MTLQAPEEFKSNSAPTNLGKRGRKNSEEKKVVDLINTKKSKRRKMSGDRKVSGEF